MVKLLVPIVLLLALVVGSIALDRPTPPADFTFINRGEVNTLNIQTTTFMQDFRVARILWEGLVSMDVFDAAMKTIPGVAESWSISDDQLTYTFKLRPDAKWSNGEPQRASDTVFSWRRALMPDLGNKYVDLLFIVKGGKAFYDWRTEQLNLLAQGQSPYGRGDELWEATKVKFDEMVGVKAIDDRTVVVTLERPLPYFMDLVAFPILFPVYPPLVDPDAEGSFERISPVTGRLELQSGWTKPGVLVSNGPMRLTRWRFKRDMAFERNEHYWDQASIGTDRIVQLSVDDANAALLAYETGGVDWVAELDASKYGFILYREKLKFLDEHREAYDAMVAQGMDPIEIARRLPDDPRNHFHPFPAFGTYFWNFNCAPRLPDGRANPFHDPRVRRAFAMVIDKRAITEQIRGLGEPVARTLIPPGSLGEYTSPAGLKCVSDVATQAERDAIVAEARALLAEAGHPNPRESFIEVPILFNKDGGHDKIAESIKAAWERSFGITCRLDMKDVNTYRNELAENNFVTARAGWYGDYGDPTTFLDLSMTGNGNNDRRYSSPRFDGLLKQAAETRDAGARRAILEEAERFLMDEEVPLVPLFHYVTPMVFNAHRTSGLTSHPRQDQYPALADMLNDDKGSNTPRAIPPTGVAGGGRSPTR